MPKEQFNRSKFTVKLDLFDKVGDDTTASYIIKYRNNQIGTAVFTSNKPGPIAGTNMIEIRLNKEAFDFETPTFVYPVIKRQNISFAEATLEQYIGNILANESNS